MFFGTSISGPAFSVPLILQLSNMLNLIVIILNRSKTDNARASDNNVNENMFCCFQALVTAEINIDEVVILNNDRQIIVSHRSRNASKHFYCASLFIRERKRDINTTSLSVCPSVRHTLVLPKRKNITFLLIAFYFLGTVFIVRRN